jgi:hypothetical protein
MTTSTRDLFRSTVADLADKARVTLPDSNGRIDSAVKLVLAGDVLLQDDGTALVQSGTDPLTMYTVNGTCACRDFPQAPQHFCKHRIARAMMIRTDRAIDVTPQQLSPGPAPIFPERPVSMNVHVPVCGRDVLVTLRGTDEAAVLARLETLLAKYPIEPTQAAPEQAHGEGWGHIHATQMRFNPGKNGSRGWFSHKVGETWCKGKAQRS